METFGVVAEYDPHEDVYDILANFQGPFSIHTVMARALKVPGNRLRLRMPPDSGGSFGVKQGVAPYAVLIGVAARIAGQPVKWIEDRLEHLGAAVAATNRVTTLEAAVAADGRISALDWDQVEDCGAYPRAPEPATLYRMHGNMTGAYDIRHVAMRNRVVLTNKAPTGLVRGFGGPQVYFALERLMQRIAVELGLDPLDVIRRNLIPAGAFPYRTATGALYDSGDYQKAHRRCARRGRLAELERPPRRRRAPPAGITASASPPSSSPASPTWATSPRSSPPQERRKAGPKNGAQATATVAIDPVGSVSVHVASTPQGQGHRTVLAQVVADVFGLPRGDIRVVADLDTGKDAWSIASGNYSSRFAAAVAGTAHLAATRLRDKLALIAVAPAQGRADANRLRRRHDLRQASGKPDKTIAFGRIAALSHWSPALLPDGVDQTIRETAFWTPPQLSAPTEDDEINSSLCHGFIFDMAGVEVDPVTRPGADRPLRHHARLRPRAASRHGRGPDQGRLRAGARRDLLRGARLCRGRRLPDRHLRRLPAADRDRDAGYRDPAYRDALALHAARRQGRRRRQLHVDAGLPRECDRGRARRRRRSTLPLTPARLAALAARPEPARPARPDGAPAAKPGDRALARRRARRSVAAAPEAIWAMLLDVDTLASIIPGCHGVRKLSETHFKADVTLGVGPVKGRYKAEIELSDLDPPQGRDADRLGRRRARHRRRRRPRHADARRRGRDRDPLQLRGRGRRQGRGHWRAAARRRGQGDHRPVLRGAGAQGVAAASPASFARLFGRRA